MFLGSCGDALKEGIPRHLSYSINTQTHERGASLISMYEQTVAFLSDIYMTFCPKRGPDKRVFDNPSGLGSVLPPPPPDGVGSVFVPSDLSVPAGHFACVSECGLEIRHGRHMPAARRAADE